MRDCISWSCLHVITFTGVFLCERQMKPKKQCSPPICLWQCMHGLRPETMTYSISTWKSLQLPVHHIRSSIGYNSHLNGSLHLLEGIRVGALNKRLNLSDKWDKGIHDWFLLFTALIPSQGIPLCTCRKSAMVHGDAGIWGLGRGSG